MAGGVVTRGLLRIFVHREFVSASLFPSSALPDQSRRWIGRGHSAVCESSIATDDRRDLTRVTSEKAVLYPEGQKREMSTNRPCAFLDCGIARRRVSPHGH